MFKRKEISVLGWMILILILQIPILNVIFVIWVILSNRANRTVKNFFFAYLVFWALSFFGIFSVTFESLQGIF
jgi:hypothetical protein